MEGKDLTRRNDAGIETAMGRLLQGGVIAAGTVMVCGGCLYLIRHGGETPDYAKFHGVLPEFKSLGGIWTGVRARQARAILQFGALIMIATPVLRVMFAVVAFAKNRDWMYTAISGIVLGLLAYALFGVG